jgi:hypothetical protein
MEPHTQFRLPISTVNRFGRIQAVPNSIALCFMMCYNMRLSVGDALERFCKLKRWIPDKQALEACKIDEHGCLVREDHHGKLWRIPGVTHFLVGEPEQFGCCMPSIVALLAGLLKQWTLYHMQRICRMLTGCSPSKFGNDLNASTCLVCLFWNE